MATLNRLSKSTLALAIAQAVAAPLHAASIVVDSALDTIVEDDMCTLREAITSAEQDEASNADCADGAGADAITFINLGANPIITLTNGELPQISSEITITGDGDLEINANDASRIFNVSNGADLMINSLVLSNGSSSSAGGAILAFNSSVELISSKVQYSYSERTGGGVYSNNGTLTISTSTISANSSDQSGTAYGVNGGGVAVINGHLDVYDSLITANASRKGGAGILLNNSTASIDESTISSNTVTGGLNYRGGGIQVVYLTPMDAFNPPAGQQADVVISDTEIIDNGAPRGAGMYILGIPNEGATFDIQVSLSNVSSNTATRGSGGIGASGAGTNMSIIGSTLSDNYSTFAGGLFGNDATFRIESSTVSTNTSASSGGGITLLGSETLGNSDISNSTISGNVALSGGGGGINMNSQLDVNIVNSTIVLNTASSYGGGIYAQYGIDNLNLVNNIISGNNADQGDEVAGYGTTQNSSNNVFGSSSISTADAFFEFSPGGGDALATTDGNETTDLAAIFTPMLANNGGLTLTHALVDDSPAVDGGDNAVCAAAPINNLDQRGEPRPLGNACDVGAVESTFERAIGSSSIFVVPLPDGGSVIFEL